METTPDSVAAGDDEYVVRVRICGTGEESKAAAASLKCIMACVFETRRDVLQ